MEIEQDLDELSEEDNSSISANNNNSLASSALFKEKKYKTGVVYLSFIPPFMSADILRRMLSKHAPVGRIFIQIVQEPGERRKKRNKEDTLYEGWVEFLKKKHAKAIAAILNNTKMGGKKKSRFYDCLWNIKYLPRFKWVHLMERLNYEKAVMKQKLRAEISQAKRVANHFKDAVDRQELNNKKMKKDQSAIMDVAANEENSNQLTERFRQRESKDDKSKKISEDKRENFLKSLFS